MDRPRPGALLELPRAMQQKGLDFGGSPGSGPGRRKALTVSEITDRIQGVLETEFFDVAGWGNLTGFLNKRMSSERVARVGLDALRKGKMDAMPGAMNNVAIFAQRFLPRTWVASMSRRLMGGRPYPSR